MIRFAKVSSFYPDGLTQLYEQQPELRYASYARQFAAMMSQGIGWADFWITNLNKTGKFQAELFIINNEFAQKKWANENGFSYTESNWMNEIVIEQVRQFSPQIFFANDYVFLKNETVGFIRKSNQSIKAVIGWDGIGMCDKDRFTHCDMVLLCNETFLEYYRNVGFRSYVFPFGFESSLLDKLVLNRTLYDISFAGSLTLRSGGHHQRMKLLSQIGGSFKVDYWLSSFDSSKIYLYKQILLRLKGAAFSDVRDIIRLWHLNKGSVYGLDMYQVLADSIITVNSHIDTAFNIAGNIRLWEATGVGTCLVTDWKPNLGDIFKIDEEVIAYKSAEECIEKIGWLLSHPEQRKAIAIAGQKRTLEEYSYEKRIREFIPILESLI